MLVAFAAGLSSVASMAAIAVAAAVEQAVPYGARVSRALGLLLLAYGGVRLLGI